MSRLDAIAEELGISHDGAKSFASAVRERLDVAPGYALMLQAIRRCKQTNSHPSAAQVTALLQQIMGDADHRRAAVGRGPGLRPQRRQDRARDKRAKKS